MYDPDSEYLNPANNPTLDDVIRAIRDYEWWKRHGADVSIKAVSKLCELGMEPLDAAEFASDLVQVGAEEHGG